MKIFNTIADLESASLKAGQLVRVKGVGLFSVESSGAGYTLANGNKAVIEDANIPDPSDVTSGTQPTAATMAYVPAGTGAVTTDVQSKLREIVSVKDFGAVGDGVTDDTVAIQAALDTGAAEIHIPEGSYLVSLAFRSNSSRLSSSILYSENSVNISGAGKIIVNESTSTLIMLHLYNCDSVNIEGISFDGQYTGFATNTYNTSQFGLVVERVKRASVLNCSFENISNIGLGITGSITDSDSSFVSEEAVVDRCYFSKVYQNSSSFNGVMDIKVINCSFVDSISTGWKFGGRHYELDSLLFSGNVSKFTAGFATYTDITSTSMVDVHSAYKNVILENNFFDFDNCTNTSLGLAVTLDDVAPFTASENVVIKNNQIRNLSGSGSSGIYAHNGVKYTGIYDNLITGSPSNAIYYEAYVTHQPTDNSFTATGNTILGAVTSCIYVANTSSVSKGLISNNTLEATASVYGVYVQVDTLIDANMTISNNNISVNTLGVRCNGQLSHVSISDNIIKTQNGAGSAGVFSQATDEYGYLSLQNNIIRSAETGYKLFNFESVTVGGNAFYDCTTAEYLSATDASNFTLNSYNNVTTLRSFNSITNNFGVFKGTSSPNGVLEASYGSQFISSDGTGTTDLYIKETASGLSGWVAK